jgi:CRP-like cAMP-binding protein
MIVSNHNTKYCKECISYNSGCFRLLNTIDLKKLEKYKVIDNYKKNEAVFRAGHIPTGVYCLSSGKVKISKTGFDGKEQILRIALPGSLIGLRAFIGNSEYYSTAKALENSTICFIPKSIFKEMQDKYPDLTGCILTSLSKMLIEIEEKMISMAQKPVRSRVAETLLNLFEVYESHPALDKKDSENSVCLTRDDLANMVGTATETVIRLLASFKNEGIIDIKGRSLILKDKNKLGKIINL